MDAIFNKYRDYKILEKENEKLIKNNNILEKRIYKMKIFLLIQVSSSLLLILFLKNKNKIK